MTTTDVAPAGTDEASIRRRVRELLGAEAIRQATPLDLSRTFRDTLFIYLLLCLSIGGTIAAHHFVGLSALLGAPVFMLLNGIAFNWINVQIHEASHFLLLSRRRANDTYCNLALASFALQDVQGYRRTHSMHHARLHSEADPDLWVYMSHAGSSRAVLRGALEDLLLVTVFKRRRQLRDFHAAANLPADTNRPALALAAAKLAAQAFVLAVYVAGCGWPGFLYYAAFYLYPLLGIFPLLVRIRTVVQHFMPANRVAGGTAGMFVSRSTEAPLWQFVLIGGRMDYHFEHHLMPTIPYYGLRDLHRKLVEYGLFDELAAGSGRRLRTTTYLQEYLALVIR